MASQDETFGGWGGNQHTHGDPLGERPAAQEQADEAPPAADPPPQRHYPTRTCRICLEEVLPRFETPAGAMPAMLQPRPKVTYTSEDPSLGRLISPCKCRGTQKFIHEGCLRAWRLSNPTLERNFWECPTCGFKYQMSRMVWADYITSWFTQIALTFTIMAFLVFLLGFIADPIINLYVDPLDTITSIPSAGVAALVDDDEDAGWIEHFLKGLASLGMLGFAKVLFAMSPWQLFLRGGIGGGHGRRRGGGRDRLEGVSWTVVVIGLVTFLIAVWSWVRTWTASTLEKAGQRVVDIQGPEDDEEEIETVQTPATDNGTVKTPTEEFRKTQ